MNCDHCGKAVRLEGIDIAAERDFDGKIITPEFRPNMQIAYCNHCGYWTSHRHNELKSIEDQA